MRQPIHIQRRIRVCDFCSGLCCEARVLSQTPRTRNRRKIMVIVSFWSLGGEGYLVGLFS